jgi:hypothetical protein
MVIVPNCQKKADGQAKASRRQGRKHAADCNAPAYFRMSFRTKLTLGPTT